MHCPNPTSYVLNRFRSFNCFSSGDSAINGDHGAELKNGKSKDSRRLRGTKPSYQTQKPSTEVSSLHAEPTSAFLNLAAEIRLQIYEYCIADKFVFQITSCHKEDSYGQIFNPTRARYPPWWPTNQHIRSRNEGCSLVLHRAVFNEVICSLPRAGFQMPDVFLRPITQCHMTASNLIAGNWTMFNDPKNPKQNDVCGPYTRYQNHRHEAWAGLSLILTCRQIYAEATHTLYSRNTFSFYSFYYLDYFRKNVPANAFSSIAFLNISVCPGVDRQCSTFGWLSRSAWKTGWESIARDMTGLKELDLEIVVAEHFVPDMRVMVSSIALWDKIFVALFAEWLEDIKVLPKMRYARVQANLLAGLNPAPMPFLCKECEALEEYLSPSYKDHGLSPEARDRWLDAMEHTEMGWY